MTAGRRDLLPSKIERVKFTWPMGFEIPDVFVVGYGLDYHDAYRNLPYLAALEPADIGDK